MVESYLPTADSGLVENERLDEVQRWLLDGTLLATGQCRALVKKLKVITSESTGGAAHQVVGGRAECLEPLSTLSIILELRIHELWIVYHSWNLIFGKWRLGYQELKVILYCMGSSSRSAWVTWEALSMYTCTHKTHMGLNRSSLHRWIMMLLKVINY